MRFPLNLDLFSATPSSFARLVSGLNQKPQIGACTGCGLIVFTAGRTRNFFAFYRDDNTQVCQTGPDSPNGISVTFL